MSTEHMVTPSSRWAGDGLPDPHGDRYACERAALALGHLTDDELANAVYLHGNEQPSMADLVAGKALSGIVYLTAAKERIRWLSRSLAATGKQHVGEVHPDDVAVDAFAAAMKAKMAAARAKGRGGWEDPSQCSAVDLTRLLRDHVEKGDPRDVANFCMMLHQRGEAIAAQVGEVQGNALSWIERIEQSIRIGNYTTASRELGEMKAALAARQPGAQVPGWSGWATQKPGHMPKLWGTREIAELNHDLTGDARLIFLSEQPAQGIDPGQFRPAVELLVQKAKDGVTACRMYWGPTNPDATEKAARKLAEAERLLALIEQRDAAPGVLS
jgi:hypothetical protein